MTDDTTIIPFRQPGSILDPLTGIGRKGMRRGAPSVQAPRRMKMASPVVPFNGHRDRRPSVFMWPISASSPDFAESHLRNPETNLVREPLRV